MVKKCTRKSTWLILKHRQSKHLTNTQKYASLIFLTQGNAVHLQGVDRPLTLATTIYQKRKSVALQYLLSIGRHLLRLLFIISDLKSYLRTDLTTKKHNMK